MLGGYAGKILPGCSNNRYFLNKVEVYSDGKRPIH
jgi:hypothetical protein